MQLMRLTASITLGLGIFVSEPSLAVTLDPVRGDVSINQGNGVFRRVTGTMQANIGDSVMVSPGGAAWLVYPDACAVEIKPGAVVTVTGLSPCEVPSDLTPPTQFSVNNGVALGALVLGGAVVGAILLLNKDDKPASP